MSVTTKVFAATRKKSGKGSQSVIIREADKDFFNNEKVVVTNPKNGNFVHSQVKNGEIQVGRRALDVEPGDTVLIR
ncbi:MAG: hypothetical protein P8P30_09870 [Rickettsiales bacterium]|nr:hypothetical protein [Rickettsiales bacterium]